VAADGSHPPAVRGPVPGSHGAPSTLRTCPARAPTMAGRTTS